MGISRLTGTAWHVETLHGEAERRRHKSRCSYFDGGQCVYSFSRCIGSAHCMIYTEARSQNHCEPVSGATEPPYKHTSDNKYPRKIGISTTFKLFDFSENQRLTLTIVPSGGKVITDSEYWISKETPLATALIGKRKGDVVIVNDRKYQVVYIE